MIITNLKRQTKEAHVTFYDSASNASFWRGVDYYKQQKVLDFAEREGGIIEGTVAGSEGQRYKVAIDLVHPKKSTCNCKFAEGRRVVCKHMVALYFASVPGSYEAFENDRRNWEAQIELEERRWREETRRRIDEYVAALSAKEARTRLADLLFEEALDERYRRDDGYDYW